MHDPSLFYLVDSDKSFYEAGLDLEPVVQRLGFVVLHRHRFGELLERHGAEIDDDCLVVDVCNYRLAEQWLQGGAAHCLTLPWRIAIFTEDGTTRIGLLRPTALPGDPALAAEIEARLVQIVDETR